MDWVTGILAVILLDIVLSGDNAIVIAMVANQLPRTQRDAAIAAGMAGALVLRITFCVLAGTILLTPYVGPVANTVGGAYLLWVAYQLYVPPSEDEIERGMASTFAGALTKIMLADVSMSLDNIVAVAGIAGGAAVVMSIGLIGSVVTLAFFAKAISALMQRYSWLNLVGAILVALVGARMLYHAIA